MDRCDCCHVLLQEGEMREVGVCRFCHLCFRRWLLLAGVDERRFVQDYCL